MLGFLILSAAFVGGMAAIATQNPTTQTDNTAPPAHPPNIPLVPTIQQPLTFGEFMKQNPIE